MKSISDSANQHALEEFLEDLIVHSNRPDQVDFLLEILQQIRHAGGETVDECTPASQRAELRLDRYDIFKMCPDRIVRIGFVKGAENAKRVLPSLNALGGSLYFVYDSGPE